MTDKIKCRECEGNTLFDCPVCHRTGWEEVEGWDVESLLRAGCEMTYEEAVVRWMDENGDCFATADELARSYGLEPVKMFKEAAE